MKLLVLLIGIVAVALFVYLFYVLLKGDNQE